MHACEGRNGDSVGLYWKKCTINLDRLGHCGCCQFGNGSPATSCDSLAGLSAPPPPAAAAAAGVRLCIFKSIRLIDLYRCDPPQPISPRAELIPAGQRFARSWPLVAGQKKLWPPGRSPSLHYLETNFFRPFDFVL